MTPNQLTGAARNLAHGLGIPVYIREGRIYQQGPGLAFLPPGGARPPVAGAPSLEEEEVDELELNDGNPACRPPEIVGGF